MPNSYTSLNYHVIFSTRDRAPHIAADLGARLFEYIGGIVREQGGRLLGAGGTLDHVHLLMSLHPQRSLSDVLRELKAGSSRWVHETQPDKMEFAWQDGYGAFSVSQSNLDQVKAYISKQDEHHRRKSYQEEFVEFLRRHDIPYDERYVAR